MKIAVIGACGKTGRLVCEQAIARGHKVVGLSRSACDIQGVEFAIGDALNIKDIDEAIAGCDAVISAIGHVKLKETNTQTEATKLVIESMKKHKIKRIISLTGSGVRVPGDKISLIDRVMNSSLKLIDKSRVVDGIKHYKALKQSNLDWTVLRVLKLTNIDKIQNYSLTTGGPAKTLISRKTVAKILVDLAESKEWAQKAPVASN